jgi:lipopolysaccharide export system ATP-binding protein
MSFKDLLGLFRSEPSPRRDRRGRRRPTIDVEPSLAKAAAPPPVAPVAPPPTPVVTAPPRPVATKPAQPVALNPPAPVPAATRVPQPAQPIKPVPAAVENKPQPQAPTPIAAAQAARTAPRPRLVAENAGLLANNLGKRFKNRPVVRDVSLRVNRGEAVGLLGPNGAGKTTCFYMITGLISPDYGSIIMDGVDLSDLPMYRRARLGIGYLPQEASIFRGLTVEQNIRSVLEVVEPRADRREPRLDELLAEFNISHLRRTPALALSGGERRRCEIARALASKPNHMLLDEPFAGIDPIAVRDIRELVSHLQDRGIGVLITDHNVRETLEIVDRAYIIHEGRVLMEGRPAEIVANTDVRRVYLGDRFSL